MPGLNDVAPLFGGGVARTVRTSYLSIQQLDPFGWQPVAFCDALTIELFGVTVIGNLDEKSSAAL